MNKQILIFAFLAACKRGKPCKPIDQIARNTEWSISIITALGDISISPSGIALNRPLTPSQSEQFDFELEKDEFENMRDAYYLAIRGNFKTRLDYLK